MSTTSVPCGPAQSEAVPSKEDRPSSPQYTIETLSDFATVPPERLSACLRDFAHWVAIRRQFPLSMEMPDGTVLAAVTMAHTFEWHDDGVEGINEIRVSIPGETS